MEFEKLFALLEEKKLKELHAELVELKPADVAQFLSEADEREAPRVFRLLPKSLAAEVFVEMDSDRQEKLITDFSDKELKSVVEELFIDDTVDIIEEMPANVVRRILSQSDAETRASINAILQYPEDSAGSIMTTEYVGLKRGMTVRDAFTRIRAVGVDKETLYTCYVTDAERRLQGVITVRKLLLSDDSALIDDIMEINIISVSTHADREEAVGLFEKYHFLAIPVTDNESRLVGIITIDDALRVIREEATEDIVKMSGVVSADRPYLKTGVFSVWAARAPWLLILMVGATFTGMIIRGYENTLGVSIALTMCIPMLTDAGGNAGAQASVSVIRGIALGEIRFKDIFRVVWKETRVSLLLGVTLAAATFGKLMVIDQFYKIEHGYIIAAVVCITMVLTLFLAKVIGGSLPLLIKKIRLDPAVVAEPAITTVVDTIALLVYCGVAVMLLKPFAAF